MFRLADNIQDIRKHKIYTVACICILLLLAVALVFGQTVRHEFMHCDDEQYVYGNPQVRNGLTVHGIAWAFTKSHASNWHPLTWLSHMFDVQVYGLHPGGHHLTSVLLHAATTILLFVLLWRMTGFLWRSAFVAAVFAVHPLRAESVAWVAERKDVLSGLFFMLTLWAYMVYARGPFSLRRYLTVAVFFALGLMSKPMLVTLPFVLLLLDYWPLGRMEPATGGFAPFPRRVIVEKLPLLILTVASCIVTFFAQSKGITPMEVIPIHSRFANAFVSYMTYIEKFFFPTGLAVYYPHLGSDFPIWKAVASMLTLGGISVAAVAWRRRFPYFFVGWFWYLGMLVPVIGLVQVGSQSMADRYTYLPQIGLCLSVTWGVAQLASSWRYRRRFCGTASVLIVLVLMGLAWRQTSYWRDSETIWTQASTRTADSYFLHYNLGIALASRGKLDAAIDHYQKALEIKPRSIEALSNLGVILADLGQYEAAMAQYQKALDIGPKEAKAYNNMGLALIGLGRMDEAVSYYRRAIEIQPDFAEAHYNLGIISGSLGQVDTAIDCYNKALEIEPGLAEAHNRLGMLLGNRGRMNEAITHFERALESRPNDVEAHINLGNAFASEGRIDAAVPHYQKALELKPGNAVIHNSLGMALASRGQIDEAIIHFRKAVEIKPDYAEAHENLVLVLRQRGQS